MVPACCMFPRKAMLAGRWLWYETATGSRWTFRIGGLMCCWRRLNWRPGARPGPALRLATGAAMEPCIASASRKPMRAAILIFWLAMTRRSSRRFINCETMSNSPHPQRWVMISLAFFATVINYLDRQTLSVVATVLLDQLGMNSVDYSILLFVFMFA